MNRRSKEKRKVGVYLPRELVERMELYLSRSMTGGTLTALIERSVEAVLDEAGVRLDRVVRPPGPVKGSRKAEVQDEEEEEKVVPDETVGM